MYAPPDVYLPFGKPAILDCHFRANPPLKNLRWEKDGFLFDPYNVQVSTKHLSTDFICRSNKLDFPVAGSFLQTKRQLVL